MTRTVARVLAAGSPLAVLVIGTVVLADVWFDVNYRVAANTAMAVMAVMVTCFTGLYLFRSRWRSNRIGRIFAAATVFLALYLTQGAVAVWVSNDYPGRHLLRFTIYTLGAVAYVPMLISLWREQQRDRRDERVR